MTNDPADQHSPTDRQRILRIATRHSPLAMWQAQWVASELSGRKISSTLVPLVSGGDIDMRPMAVAAPGETRTVGVFTKRIQQALVDDEADVAVHSLKDLPTAVDERFTLAAVPPRADVRDALVSDQRYTIESLPPSAIVGTGSKRRAAQLRRRRPDLRLMPIRGNVQTRLAKLRNGDFDAIVLAEAGLQRLAMDKLPRHLLSLDQCLPAPGQAALAIEVRSDDPSAASTMALLDHFETHAAVLAERTMLSQLDGGCLAPIAALATWNQSEIHLRGIVMSHDGEEHLEYSESATVKSMPDAVALGQRVAKHFSDRGAAEILRRSSE